MHILLFLGLDLVVVATEIIMMLVVGKEPDDRKTFLPLGFVWISMLLSGCAAIAFFKDLVFLLINRDPYYPIGAIWRIFGLAINLFSTFYSLIRSHRESKPSKK